MIDELIVQTIAGIIGFWLAKEFVPGFEFMGTARTLIYAGFVFGLINTLIKPILNLITFPLRILTLGLFTLVMNMAIIWVIDIFFPQFNIHGLIALFWTTVILWILSSIYRLKKIKK